LSQSGAGECLDVESGLRSVVYAAGAEYVVGSKSFSPMPWNLVLDIVDSWVKTVSLEIPGVLADFAHVSDAVMDERSLLYS